MPSDLLNAVGAFLQSFIALFGALLVAFWISLVIWTVRDMRSRSRDVLATILASLLVLLFGPLGWLLYLLLRPRETLADTYERMLEEETLLRGMEEQPVCPTCQHKTQPDWQICPYCATQLRQPCASCGKLLDLSWQICPYCGHVPADASPIQPIAVEQPPVGTTWVKPASSNFR